MKVKSLNIEPKFVGNKAKGRLSKRVFQEKQSTPNFPQNEHFFPPDTHTHMYVCILEGKKCSLFGKFGELCFSCNTRFGIRLLPYYRRVFEPNDFWFNYGFNTDNTNLDEICGFCNCHAFRFNMATSHTFLEFMKPYKAFTI